MHHITFNSGGNFFAGLFFAVVPLLLLLVVMSRGRQLDSWPVQFDTRMHHLPVIILLLAYYGVIYWWLFYDQFYAVVAEASGDWALQYRVPSRTHHVQAVDVADISVMSGDRRTHKMARIVIQTTDGLRYESAQVSKHRAQEYVEILAQLRKSALVTD